MNKIYRSGNYVVVEVTGATYEFAIGKTAYSERERDGVTNFILNESEDGRFFIDLADVTAGSWFLEDGVTAYSVATLTTFLRENTGFSPASGGSGAVVIGSNLTKSGQTISYATGDDGDLQSGRGLDFTTLLVDNPHGNRERFTDELGTQVYTNNIMIDWTTYDGVTALGIHKTPSPSDTWANNVAYCLGLVVAGFGDWHMPNIQEAWNLANISLTGGHMFAWTPLNVTLVSNGIMTSNTYLYATHQFYLVYGNGTMSAFSKVGTWKTLPHRYFTKAELGL